MLRVCARERERGDELPLISPPFSIEELTFKHFIELRAKRLRDASDFPRAFSSYFPIPFLNAEISDIVFHART